MFFLFVRGGTFCFSAAKLEIITETGSTKKAHISTKTVQYELLQRPVPVCPQFCGRFTKMFLTKCGQIVGG